MVSSVPRKSAIRRSSSRWMSWVPQMKRTELSPKPRFSSPRAGGGEHSRIVSETEVVVGAEVQDFLSPDPNESALRREDQPLPLLEPGLLDGSQFAADG